MATNLTIATDFLRAWARSDVAAFSALLGPELTFSSPRVELNDRAEAIEAMAGFAAVVTGVDIVAAAENGADVLVLYDMHTAPYGTIRAVDHYRIADGQISELRVLFDTAPLT